MTKQTEFIPFMGVVEFDDNTRVNETLTNEKETGVYMNTEQTITEKVLSYMKANPKATPRTVAQECGVGLGNVYTARHVARKTGSLTVKKKPTNTKRVMQYIKNNPNAGAKEIAKEVGLSPYQVHQIVYYVKSKGKKVTKATKVAKVTKTSPTKEVKDNVNHPPHYKVGGIETIDFIEAKGLGYNLGNVIKYLTRADHKGNKLEDLKKGAWYLLREIKSLEKAK